MHNLKKDSDKFEIESQMTHHVVYSKQFRIYNTRVKIFLHVLVKLIPYCEWYRLIKLAFA